MTSALAPPASSTHPDATHPDATHPDATHPDATDSDAIDSDGTHSDGTHPDATESATAPRLRLRPRHGGPVDGFVDGGWWPRSRDLSVELPGLLARMVADGYPIRRVTYNLAAWDPAPRRVTVGTQVVKLGGFRSQSPVELVLVDSGGWRRIVLAVVAPETDPSVADSELAQAATPGDGHRASEILAARPDPA